MCLYHKNIKVIEINRAATTEKTVQEIFSTHLLEMLDWGIRREFLLIVVSVKIFVLELQNR